MIDCFAERPGVPRSEVTRWLPLPGGAPANVACAISKLGDRADFVGAVGSDHWGDALMQLLTDMGVGHRGVQRRLKAPTRQVLYTTSQTDSLSSALGHSHHTFAGFSESDPTVFADAHLFADGLEDDLFIGADFLVLGTVAMAYSDTRQSVEKALSLAKANQLSILVDVNWQPMFWPNPAEAPGRVYDLLKQVHYLKVSDDEAEWLFGTHSPQAIAQQFPHLKGVLVMAEAQGCTYCFRQISGHVPEFKVDVEEITGAGDAFTAGFIHRLMQKGPGCLKDANIVREIVTYASAVGALTTTRPGAIAALPSPKEVEVFLYLN